MDTRLGILSAAAFAGVVIGGLLIADPGVAGSLNASGLFGDEDEEYEEYDDEGGEREGYEDDDEDEHEEDDDHEDERDGSGSTRSTDVRFARDSHDDDHEDDD